MQNYVPTFNQYVNESLKAEQPMIATHTLAESLLAKKGFSDRERLCFWLLKESDTPIHEWDPLNEGLLNKLKEIGQKAVKGGKEFTSGLKAAVGKEISGAPEFFKALASGVKNLVDYIVSFLKKAAGLMFGTPIEWARKAMGSGYQKLESATKEEATKNETKISEEADGVSQMVVGAATLLTPGKIGHGIESGMAKADTTDVPEENLAIVAEQVILAVAEAIKMHTAQEIREGMAVMCSMNEGHTKIPFISTISSLLEKVPPFSWLTTLAEFLGANTNRALSKLSSTLKDKGTIKEATEFVVIGTLVGLGLEYIVKTGAKSAIGVLFPPVHATFVVLGTIATAICVVHVASTVIDGLKGKSIEIMNQAKSITA